MKIISINCRFCGTKLGEQSLPLIPPGQVVTPEEVGILDSRCDSCANDYGNFKEMSMFYNDNVSTDIEAQKTFFTNSEYKIDKFVDNLIFNHPEVIFSNATRSEEIETVNADKVESLGMTELTNEQRVAVVNRYKEEHEDHDAIDAELVPSIITEVLSE